MASPELKILRVFSSTAEPLSSSHYLAEYEAIIVEPEWQRLLVLGPTAGDVVRAEEVFSRKPRELNEFLTAGGLLVVLLVPAENRTFMSHGGDDNHSWWAKSLAASYPGTHAIIVPGSGTSVVPTGTGSEFEKYLELNQSYRARLGTWFENRDNVRTLANNRAGGAVAVEVVVGAGTIVCVPPPADANGEKALLDAVTSFLGHRFGPGLKWPLPEEEELERERQRILRDFHSATAEVATRQRAVQDRKRAVFTRSQVSRGVRYLEQATRAGSTPKQTMTALYDLIEMLRDYYDAGWDGMADALGVPHHSVDRIKKLANKPELHLRHTTADDPEGVDQAQFDKAVADGTTILSAFIAREFAETDKVPTTT
jgi:hypothetical protein